MHYAIDHIKSEKFEFIRPIRFFWSLAKSGVPVVDVRQKLFFQERHSNWESSKKSTEKASNQEGESIFCAKTEWIIDYVSNKKVQRSVQNMVMLIIGMPGFYILKI